MKKKIDKDILKRIELLENKYPYVDIEKIKEGINNLIIFLEKYFGYSIRERIDFSKLNYKKTEDTERMLLEQLTTEELKKIVDDINRRKK